jgi:hypothetical protein
MTYAAAGLAVVRRAKPRVTITERPRIFAILSSIG